MHGAGRRYNGFRKHPMRLVRVAVAFRPLRFGAFAPVSDVADGIGYADVETHPTRSWFAI